MTSYKSILIKMPDALSGFIAMVVVLFIAYLLFTYKLLRDQIEEQKRDGTHINMHYVYWPWNMLMINENSPTRRPSSQCSCKGPCQCRNRRASITTDTRGYRISCNEDKSSKMYYQKEQMVGSRAAKPSGHMKFASVFS